MKKKKIKQKELPLKFVKKSNFLLLKVFCSDEYFSDCNFAIMKLTKEVKNNLIELKAIMDIVLGKTRRNGANEDNGSNSVDLFKMTYWSPSWSPTFLLDTDFPEDFLVDKMFEADEEIQYLNKMIKEKEGGEVLRCEVRLLHVYEEGIVFEVSVKHANIQLETCTISFEDLGI